MILGPPAAHDASNSDIRKGVSKHLADRRLPALLAWTIEVTYLGVESSSDTQQPILLFCFWFVAEMKEFVLFGREANGYTTDLGEELLRVAPDLHGGLGADVLCTHGEEERECLSSS
jgi:hypothetical protein